MKKRITVALCLLICTFFICGCSTSKVETPSETSEEVPVGTQTNYEYPASDFGAIKSESVLIDILEKEELSTYSIITEQGATYSGVVTAVTKEEINDALQGHEYAATDVDVVSEGSARQVKNLFDVSDPTHVIQMISLMDAGRNDINEHYGGFIKYYKDHNLKTTCDNVKVEKIIYSPSNEYDIPDCIGVKLKVDVTTAKGEGDLTKVSYIPAVGETKTLSVYMVGNACMDKSFSLYTMKVEDVFFGRAWEE